MSVRRVESYEIRKVVEFMTTFAEESHWVEVDIEHATKFYETRVSDGSTIVLVIEKEDKIIGSFGFIIFPDLHSGKLTAVETFWFMHPKHRGKGKQLFTEFERIAVKENCKKLAMVHLVEPDSKNQRLEKLIEKFYIANGYILVEQHFIKEV